MLVIEGAEVKLIGLCLLQLMKVMGNENANKLLEWKISSDDLIDSDADEYVHVYYQI